MSPATPAHPAPTRGFGRTSIRLSWASIVRSASSSPKSPGRPGVTWPMSTSLRSAARTVTSPLGLWTVSTSGCSRSMGMRSSWRVPASAVSVTIVPPGVVGSLVQVASNGRRAATYSAMISTRWPPSSTSTSEPRKPAVTLSRIASSSGRYSGTNWPAMSSPDLISPSGKARLTVAFPVLLSVTRMRTWRASALRGVAGPLLGGGRARDRGRRAAWPPRQR